ncbi:flagellar brake protein YcgR [Pseudocitrobacter cyperus]|uniref:Flagellar brake protein YcgR n=1 Tax=Pseudocitrobacter cyperus TaxID=3112843 RepID=A0ABV0HEC0_9ENTR
MNQYPSQFLKQNPLAVQNILRDLHRDEIPLRVSWSSGQFISRILAVSKSELVLDFGSQEYENRAVQRVENVTITAETAGAKMEFSVRQITAGEHENRPAFVLPVPPTLWFIQRREYFRITAPQHLPYFGKALLPDKQVLSFRLFDLSLGGLGALLDSQPEKALQPGMRFSQLELDMGEWGKFNFDAQLIAVSDRKVVSHKNETITTPRLSLRFLNINPAAERSLQRIIFSLEREARERANRVRD